MAYRSTVRAGTAQVYEPAHSMSEQFSRRILAQNPSVQMPNSIGLSNVESSMHWDFQTPQHYYVSRVSRGSRPDDIVPRLSAPQSRPQFRSKVVCVLDCKHCEMEVCKRGMKAILLADMNVELFSTDSPPYGVQLVNDDYRTRNCFCRIRDVACLGCGNVIGYHVTQPCEPCMDACNNGHFWMFHCTEVTSKDRLNDAGSVLVWSQIPKADSDASSPISKNAILR